MKNIANENDLRIFVEFENLLAGFTRKPDGCDERRNDMVAVMKEIGGCVVKPILVHGNKVTAVTTEMVTGKSYIEIPDTDGVVTNLPNVVPTTTHADCIPVYAYDPVKKVIGLAHAGWKGTSNGIVGELVQTMIDSFGCQPTDIYGYIAPGIGKCHFEFGADYATECFTSKYNWMQDYIISNTDDKEIAPDKVKIDLKGINKHFFNLTGVNKVQICDDCTYCDNRYYSYRRANDIERMLAYITLK